jgi:hypothetical protein
MRVAALFVLLFGCDSGSQLSVDLATDLQPRREFTRVRVERLGERDAVLDVREEPASQGSYVESVRVAEFTGLSDGSHIVRVTLLDAAGTEVIHRTIHVELQGARAVTVLITRNCRDIECPGAADDPSATECAGGVCVSPACSVDMECAQCASDVDCAPSVSCAVGRCTEGQCLFADEGACGAGAYCHPEDGCLEELVTLDAGMTDAGGRDAGACVPASCAALGYDCGTPEICGVPTPCGECTGTDTCGGGGAEFQCGNGDVTPPTVVITSAPDMLTSDGSARFTFTADDGPGVGVEVIECNVDGAGWIVCTSPLTRALGDGPHTFEVRARDRRGTTSAPVRHTWTIDTTPPVITIAPIGDPNPSRYDATPVVSFTYTCDDDTTVCEPSTPICEVDGTAVSCSLGSGAVAVGYSGPFRFGMHTLSVYVSDSAGNTGSRSRSFVVTRCANDMQYPNRSSQGLARGGCCEGLAPSDWWDFSFSFWHPRGDGSCRPPSDYDATQFESVWGGATCIGGRTTEAWGAGCTSFVGRSICLGSLAQARAYCGTDGGSGSQTPIHGRAGEGWHPPPSAGCSMGSMDDTLLLQRYGCDNVCFYSTTGASDRGSIPISESCKPGLALFCRSNPVASEVACVCATRDPYTDDGRN